MDKNKVKNIALIAVIFLLLITSITFAYLFFTKESIIKDPTTTGDKIETAEEEKEKTTDETGEICNWDELQTMINGENKRNSFIYQTMLSTSTNIYSKCKANLVTKLKEVVNKEAEDSDKEDILKEIDNNRITYLIDSNFLINTYSGIIWEVDLTNGTLSSFWETESKNVPSVEQIYVVYEDNESTVFFLSQLMGLGGSAEETELINNIVKTTCDEKAIGVWMYNTSIETFSMIKESEMCN